MLETFAVRISVFRAYTIFPEVSIDTDGSSLPSYPISAHKILRLTAGVP